MKGPMTSTLPDISRDKLDGFKKMALAVIDDMHEAAVDMASRHDHMVDLLKARVEEQDATIQKQRAAVRGVHDEAHEACDAIAAATGIEQGSLPLAIENAVGLIATLRHRIDEAQKQMSAIAAEHSPGLDLTFADLRELLADEAAGEDNAAVLQALVFDDVPSRTENINVIDSIRELCHAVRYLTLASEQQLAINAELQAKVEKRGAARSAGAAQLAAIPMEQGPFVITMKVPQGRRFWGPSVQGEAGWVSDLAGAFQYAGRVLAESVKPRRSAVVTLADARELIEAEKVVSITPPANAPTGPEAA